MNELPHVTIRKPEDSELDQIINSFGKTLEEVRSSVSEIRKNLFSIKHPTSFDQPEPKAPAPSQDNNLIDKMTRLTGLLRELSIINLELINLKNHSYAI